MNYELKRTMRTRTLRLAVHPDARVVVTAPFFYRTAMIERFVAKHERWVAKRIALLKTRHVIRVRKGEIPMLKKRALVLARARCKYFAKVYGVTFIKISIRAQKTRWGSCSRRGSLSFNYKIAALPAPVTDYVIVHELCHLLHFNHSKKFWDQVAVTIPQHLRIRKELRNTNFIFD